jgi:hypothetical protein
MRTAGRRILILAAATLGVVPAAQSPGAATVLKLKTLEYVPALQAELG